MISAATLKLLDPLPAKLETGLAPFYLIYGEQEWLISQALHFLRRSWLGEEEGEAAFESLRLDHRARWDKVEAVLANYSFFSTRRLVHLEVTGKMQESFRDALSVYLEGGGGDDLLVCITAPSLDGLVAAKNRITKAGGCVVQYKKLTAQALKPWVREQLGASKRPFSADLSDSLLRAFPGDPGAILGFIEKMDLYLPAGEEATVSVLDQLAGPSLEDNVFALADALAAGNASLLISRLNGLLASGERPERLLNALPWTVLSLLRARLLLDEGRDPASVARSLPQPPYLARQTVEKAARLDRRRLLAWLLNLQKLDYRLKSTPGADKQVLMEAYLLESLAGRYIPAEALI